MVESMTRTPSDSGDQIWLAVARNINGTWVRSIELLDDYIAFNPDVAQADLSFLDGYLQYVGAPTQTISGLPWPDGTVVQVRGDGGDAPDQTVSGGAITLDAKYSNVFVGFAYQSRHRPMRIEAGAEGGTPQGQKKLIQGLRLRVYRSLGFQIGQDDGHLDDQPMREVDDAMGAPPPMIGARPPWWVGSGEQNPQVIASPHLLSGDYPKEGDPPLTFDGDWSTDASVLVVNASSQNTTILGFVPTMDTNSGDAPARAA
jgi:hypothetical protein